MLNKLHCTTTCREPTCSGHLQLGQGGGSTHSKGENLATIQIVTDTAKYAPNIESQISTANGFMNENNLEGARPETCDNFFSSASCILNLKFLINLV